MIRDNKDNAIGANTANNLFDSSLVTSNPDGSELERLEYIQTNMNAVANASQLKKKVLATTANGVTTLFTYTGSIRIKGLFGIITTIMENKVQNMKLSVVADALAAYDICANKDIDTFAVGTALSITGTAANALVATTAVGAIAPFQASGILATSIVSGIITVTAGAANTGAITWYLVWEPLSSDATVT